MQLDMHTHSDTARIAILIKESYYQLSELTKHYIKPIQQANILDVLSCSLAYPSSKITVSQARKEILKLLPTLVNTGISYLYVADATYFKALTGKSKADSFIGYVLPCKLKGYEHIYVVLGVNYGQLLYNPNLSQRLDMSLQTLISHINGTYTVRGDIIEKADYPASTDEIEKALANLHQYPALACDIETTGLKLGSHLYSIAFAHSQHEGIAFAISDTVQLKLLKQFFERYRGKLIFHNASFDIKHIIYHCFMSHPSDTHGLLHGLSVMTKQVDDTKIIAYLAVNSTAGNQLSLKDLSHEFTGNYAIDVKDVTQHDVATVLEYNLKDTLATFWVYNKYYPLMLKDNQKSIYDEIMLPSLKTIIQLELTGMPVDMTQVNKAREELESISSQVLDKIMNNPHVKAATYELKLRELQKINAKLKTKQYGLEKVANYGFNPNSAAHLIFLFYESLGLPVIETTENKQPATSTAVLKKLKSYTDSELITELIDALVEYSNAQKVLSTFIPALENATARDGWHYLHGNFNLGATLSNRLSSSNP